MIKRIKRKTNPRNNDHNRLINAMDKNFLRMYYNSLKFSNYIASGDPENLVNTLIITKQGLDCYDCYHSFMGCECEYCSDCKFNRCLCLLDIEKKSEYTTKERIKIAKIYCELSRLFGDDFDELYIEDREKDQKFIKFIRSLTPNSSFPEYREIALSLLEAYDDSIDLSKKDLSYYDLSNMDLSNMDLSYYDLSHTNLSGTDLSGSILYRTDFAYAKITKSTNFENTLDIDQVLNLRIPNPKLRRRRKK